MAESNIVLNTEGEVKKLSDIYLNAWNLFEEVEDSELPSNSLEFQNKVKETIALFEQATVIVNQVSMFSSNELIDEVSTDSLPFMLLPYFLAKLTSKINKLNSTEILDLAEIYFKDHLQRCHEYDLCAAPKNKTDLDHTSNSMQNKSEQRELMEAAYNRNDKIAQYRKMKEIDEFMNRMRVAVKNKTADEEVRRDFFLKFLQKSIIDTKQELDTLNVMKKMVEMRLTRLNAGEQESLPNIPEVQQSKNAVHGHGHSHGGHYHQPKPKPLQPFIITRNAAQKAVFGLGYPSLPILTVDQFYQQRVDEGIFPDEQKMAKINQEKAIAAALDPNEKEDEENAVLEQQVEDDDPENLARMRRMDEYKDVVRRGDGNRYNRS